MAGKDSAGSLLPAFKKQNELVEAFPQRNKNIK